MTYSVKCNTYHIFLNTKSKPKMKMVRSSHRDTYLPLMQFSVAGQFYFILFLTF